MNFWVCGTRCSAIDDNVFQNFPKLRELDAVLWIVFGAGNMESFPGVGEASIGPKCSANIRRMFALSIASVMRSELFAPYLTKRAC